MHCKDSSGGDSSLGFTKKIYNIYFFLELVFFLILESNSYLFLHLGKVQRAELTCDVIN